MIWYNFSSAVDQISSLQQCELLLLLLCIYWGTCSLFIRTCFQLYLEDIFVNTIYFFRTLTESIKIFTHRCLQNVFCDCMGRIIYDINGVANYGDESILNYAITDYRKLQSVRELYTYIIYTVDRQNLSTAICFSNFMNFSQQFITNL